VCGRGGGEVQAAVWQQAAWSGCYCKSGLCFLCGFTERT
jgi:hypothetical protein